MRNDSIDTLVDVLRLLPAGTRVSVYHEHTGTYNRRQIGHVFLKDGALVFVPVFMFTHSLVSTPLGRQRTLPGL